MSSPATNQSYSYGHSNNSSGSTYTGGQGTSSGTTLSQWASTPDQTERFYATGQRTNRGVMQAMDKTLEFDRAFSGRT
ncbi:hypothetical protein BKA59DRAFT_119014 [Fusarium tricinctum]|uniref:Uncharacterized protein n=1 Tax=Fusarium tricinctum TaxID=61284 RepID=A0A8K0WGS5_9HYPO|nr:hypothetical protein BKA59DRAFT_119014 [Fusarium tricinctum]